MSKSNVKKITILTVSVLVLAMLLSCLIVTFSFDAKAETAGDDTTNIGEILRSGYESDGGKVFNKLFWTLISQISGISNPTKKSLNSLGKTEKTSLDFRGYNDGKDVTVTIGNKQWTAAYLSRSAPTADNPDGDPILTLWLTNAEENNVKIGQWHTQSENKKGNYVNSMYGTSYVRSVTLNNGGGYAESYDATSLTPVSQKEDSEWAIYTMTKEQGVAGSLTSFIEVPENISWQHNQTSKNKVSYPSNSSVSFNCNNNNDALDFGGDGVYGSYAEFEGYKNWANDRLWLPSVAEAGIHGEEGLWMLSDGQRSASTRVWTRSEHFYYYYHSVYALTALGSGFINSALGEYMVTDTCAIRPAFNLNLNSAAKSASLFFEEPISVVENDYNGRVQSLEDVVDKSKISWFDGDEMEIEYPDANPKDMKDEGTYSVKVTITDKDSEFIGEPDESKGESKKIRYFDFKIKKKGIDVTLSLDSANHPKVAVGTGVICSGDTAENGRAPVFGFSYKSKGGKVYDDYPAGEIGEFIATAKITNECNYELDDTYSINFTLEKTKVSRPSIAIKEKPYTGEDIEFNVSQVTDKVKITVSSANGNIVNYASGKIMAKNVDKYTVTISLADDGRATCWDSSKENDTDAYTIEISIIKKKLSASISCSDTDFSWNAGETPTMTITDERISGDSIDYYVYYLKSGDSTKYDDIDASKEIDGSSVVVKIPGDLLIGSYTFVVELKSGSLGSDNGNYYIDGGSKTMDFSVVGKGITVTPGAIKWKVNNLDIGELIDGKLILTYNGKSFKFSVDESNLKDHGVKIDTSKGDKGLEGNVEETNAGVSYKVTVWLCNYDNTVDAYSGSFTLNYEIQKAKYDMSVVKWTYDAANPFKYNGQQQTVTLTGLPSALTVIEDGYEGNRQRNAHEGYVASVLGFDNANSANYVTPEYEKTDTYIGDFEWNLTWSIDKAILTLEWENKQIAGLNFKLPQVKGENAQYVDNTKYKYYRSNGVNVGDEIQLEDITVGESAVRYWIEAFLSESASQNYEISEASKRKSFRVGSDYEKITVELEKDTFTYDGDAHGGELKVTSGTIDISKINKVYYKDSVSQENLLDGVPKDAGKYIIVLSLSEEDEEDGYALSKMQLSYSITKAKITAVWDTSGQIPIISNLSDTQKGVVGYIYYDADGNELEDGAQLEAGKTYSVKAILKDTYGDNYEFVMEDGVTVLEDPTTTEEEEFTVDENYNGGSGNGIGGIDSGNQGGDGTLGELLEKLKEIPLWQMITGIISIILTIIFLSKTASYDSKRKKYNKKSDKLDTSMYAGAYLGIAMSIWTAIACVLMGLAVISLVMMLIAKSRCNKAEEEYEERFEEYNRNKADFDTRKRDEDMKMMLMSILGGNAGQGGYAAQQGLGADDIRGIVSDTMTAMLPGMQQMLPQQASTNDELVQKLIEQNDKLMKKLSDQPTEKVIEREVAASNVNEELLKEIKALRTKPSASDETILKVVAKTEENDDTIKQLLRNQEKLMEKIMELSANSQPQVIEKEVPVEVEKIVEKEVIKEVPVEKIVEVPVPVISTEAEKSQPIKKSEKAPKLTLDEAYAKLSKTQQKYFDSLREYALTKDKCKEKKSTYFILFGQSSVNPLVKLTIKKDTTVALFKMEDEYMKDIRRDATGDGTKIKVKETEVVISDAQACKAAKNMIDLREDQIERYAELLKEQRSMRNKK